MIASRELHSLPKTYWLTYVDTADQFSMLRQCHRQSFVLFTGDGNSFNFRNLGLVEIVQVAASCDHFNVYVTHCDCGLVTEVDDCVAMCPSHRSQYIC